MVPEDTFILPAFEMVKGTVLVPGLTTEGRFGDTET
jgi:hypothetical protein